MAIAPAIVVRPTLEGGLLKRPAVLTEDMLLEAGGEKFLFLRKSDLVLSLFLTGKPEFHGLLANTSIIERIQAARDAAMEQFERIEPTSPLVTPGTPPDADDTVDTLGLDADLSSSDDDSKPSRANIGELKAQRREARAVQLREKRLREARKACMPATMDVEVELADGVLWIVRVATLERRQAPAIKLTTCNVATLLKEVRSQLAVGNVHRSAHGSKRLPGDRAQS